MAELPFTIHGCHIDRVNQDVVGTVVEAHTAAPGATCPACGVVSDAVHSSYTRTLRDLPEGNSPALSM